MSEFPTVFQPQPPPEPAYKITKASITLIGAVVFLGSAIAGIILWIVQVQGGVQADTAKLVMSEGETRAEETRKILESLDAAKADVREMNWRLTAIEKSLGGLSYLPISEFKSWTREFFALNPTLKQPETH